MKKLSVIIPVYQVECYIRSCVESLFRQGLDDDEFEVILVNDGTKDNSFAVIDDIIKRHKNIQRIDQSNQGLSAARNAGMQHSTGTYILFLDSDDLFVDGSVGPLIELAISALPDLILTDFLRLTDDDIAQEKWKDYICKGDVIPKTGKNLFLEDFNFNENYVWRTLYKRSFLEYHNIKFINGICYEDLPFIPECFLKSEDCLRVHRYLYIYRVGHESITSSMTTKKALDINQGIARIWELKDMEGLSVEVQQVLMDNLFEIFSFLLWCISKNKHVYENRVDIVRNLKQRVPNLWFSHGLKQIFVSIMFRTMPAIYLRLRAK